MKNLVSVFIAIRGVRRLPQLEQCVRSFLAQSSPPDEIVVVGKKEELNSFPEKFSLKERKVLKLVFSDVDKNEARNLGIKNTHGKYLLYADHDMEAEKHLIEKCLKKMDRYDTLIIPEKGKGGNFLENVKRLEKEIITYDLDTVTPRFFKKDIFKSSEKLFESKYGQLDEWGFNVKIKEKGASVGIATGTHFTVTEDNLTLAKEIGNKFKRGLWLKNFYEADKNEAWRRINPIKRGLVFYGKRIGFLFKDPINFVGLLFVKAVDLTAFTAGYIVGSVRQPRDSTSYRRNTIELYNQLGEEYVRRMYSSSRWSLYVDEAEKDAVRKFWNLKNKQSAKGESLLDLGMGPGRWSILFLKFGFKGVTGVDIAPKMVKVAKKAIKDRRFQAQVADMESLPFPDKSYDKVFCFRSFKYVDNPNRAIVEMERVLLPGGTIILEVSNKSLQNLAAKSLSKLIVKVMTELPLDSRWRYFANAKFFSPGDISKILTKHSLKMVKEQPLFILPSVKMPSALILLDKILFLILPKRLFARSNIFLVSK